MNKKYEDGRRNTFLSLTYIFHDRLRKSRKPVSKLSPAPIYRYQPQININLKNNHNHELHG
jgi:hypothetical protein